MLLHKRDEAGADTVIPFKKIRNFYLYDNGLQSVPWGQINPSGGWSGYTQSCTFAASYIDVQLATGNTIRYCNTRDKIDVTDFNTLHYKLSGHGSSLPDEVVLDISGVTGSYYIGVATYNELSGGTRRSTFGMFSGVSNTDLMFNYVSPYYNTGWKSGSACLVGHVTEVFLAK